MKKYVYLLCSPHSGSTLLSFLLGNHPEIATVGEVAGRTDYEGYKCSCGDPLVSCVFWKKIKDLMELKEIPFDLQNFDIFIDGRRRFDMSDRLFDYYFPLRQLDFIRDFFFKFHKKRMNWLDDTITRNILLAETITKCMDRTLFFDTTKDAYRVKHLKNRLGKNLKVIYLTRDGRGVMNSLLTKENNSNQQAVNTWVWGNLTIGKILRHYFKANDFFQLKYEDLCFDISGMLEKISRFLKIENNVDLSHFKKDNFHIIGNHMRKEFTGNIRLDEKWKKTLTKEQINLFNKTARKLNQSLGYTI